MKYNTSGKLTGRLNNIRSAIRFANLLVLVVTSVKLLAVVKVNMLIPNISVIVNCSV